MRFYILAFMVALAGCTDFEPNTREKFITTGLQGGFYPGENLKVLGSDLQRSGIVSETGDRYNYYRDSDSAEIIGMTKDEYYARSDVLAPFRPNWLTGCSVDRMSDRKTCRINMLGPTIKKGGGFFNTVNKSGNLITVCILGHDFPGRRGQIRVDHNAAITTGTSGCISGSSARRLQSQLARGSTITTRRVEWPYDYSKDKKFLISGGWLSAQKIYRFGQSADREILFNAK